MVLPSSHIFDAGYAIPSYDICTNEQIFRFRGDSYRVPARTVPLVDFKGVKVARIEDVMKVSTCKP